MNIRVGTCFSLRATLLCVLMKANTGPGSYCISHAVVSNVLIVHLVACDVPL